MDTIRLSQIQEILPTLDLFTPQEQGFAAYSAGHAVIPAVGEILFQDPPGDVHIKYGYLQQDDYYVVKLASTFPQNALRNLPPNNGLMMLFQRQTGEPRALLLDEGYLTEVRTAVAGAIAAKYLAPRHVERIGIVGTGIQARFQLRYLRAVTPCRTAMVWGRNEQSIARYQSDMEQEGFTITPARTLAELCAGCNLIVTTTTANAPLIQREHVLPGTHITAMGADMPSKQELDPLLVRDADLVVADSREQCCERGEIAHAVRQGLLERNNVFELGQIIAGTAPGRTNDQHITIADLTGVAVQDLQIARAVYEAVLLQHA